MGAGAAESELLSRGAGALQLELEAVFAVRPVMCGAAPQAPCLPRPPAPAQRLPHALRSAAWLRRPTLPGALYLLLTAALPAAGLAYLLAPEVKGFGCGVQQGDKGAAGCRRQAGTSGGACLRVASAAAAAARSPG